LLGEGLIKFSAGSDDEEEFLDVRDQIAESQIQLIQTEDMSEPTERDELPWLKDPNFKVSIWAILKENIGKDLSRMTVPVILNTPLSMCQAVVPHCEYSHLLSLAADEDNSLKRLA